ncbi:MAG: MtaA/CmuA family methyltransferase [Candidatus Heteroscillospira sp.]|jgi:MtaA/CmuA family methyltransferase
MNKETMTSYERVMAVFRGEKPDRTPVICPTSIATVECMELCGAKFPEAHTDGEKMAALAATGHDILGFDSVFPYFGVQNEAAAYGAVMDWGKLDEMPKQKKAPLDGPEGFTIPADIYERAPMKAILDALRILKEKYAGKVAVIGKVMGPWTLSYNLYGTQEFLMETVLDPDRAHEFVNTFKEASLEFAIKQVEAGADIIMLADHATGNLVSADCYEEFLFPVHKELTARFHEACPGVPLILHTCGRTHDRVHLFRETGFDAFHFDSANDTAQMMEEAGDKIILTGGINNPRVLLEGTTGDVRKNVTHLLENGVKLMSPECAIPCRVKNENLQEILRTVRDFEGIEV